MSRSIGSLNKKHISKISANCEYCNKNFERYPSWFKRPGSGRFCSMLCQRRGTIEQRKRFGIAAGRWQDGRSSYRQRALRHFGEFCKQCGYSKEKSLLWVHHKDFKRVNHDLTNLEVLCIRCHLEKHLERNRAI